MLARALAKPSNLLVLDEPTNDLDLETLDVLEEMLGDYDGTVILDQPRPRFPRPRGHLGDRARGRRTLDRICRRLYRHAGAARRRSEARGGEGRRGREKKDAEGRRTFAAPRSAGSISTRSTRWKRCPKTIAKLQAEIAKQQRHPLTIPTSTRRIARVSTQAPMRCQGTEELQSEQWLELEVCAKRSNRLGVWESVVKIAATKRSDTGCVHLLGRNDESNNDHAPSPPRSPANTARPAAVIDMDRVERNIARIQAACDAAGVANRPHIKTHKSPMLAKMQIAAGAKGITCQKLGEAEVMADAGIDDILISYNLIGDEKMARLGALQAKANMTVAADNSVVIAGLPQAAAASGRPLSVVVECDTGASAPASRRQRKRSRSRARSRRSKGLKFAGFMLYPDRDRLG